MASSLDKLASYLTEFKNLKKEFAHLDEEKMKLLTKKGEFPYDYIDSMKMLEETQLPGKDESYNKLNDSHITDEKYQHAQIVWRQFDCKTLGEYSDLYMKTDILLLVEIFENFIDQCQESYKFDPSHYLLCLDILGEPC